MQTEFDFEAAQAGLIPETQKKEYLSSKPLQYVPGGEPLEFGPVYDDAYRIEIAPPIPKIPNSPKVMGTLTYKRETDPNGKDPHAPGAKLDQGKLRPWLCIAGFARALEEVSRVTTKGAEKYTPNGWAEVENGEERYLEAFGRHLLALGRGETFDDGPKGLGPDVYHKASMIWNLLASLELELRNKK